jgi:NitT/TauT family transport system substrate-binding protein
MKASMNRTEAIALAAVAALVPRLAQAQTTPAVRVGYAPFGESLSQGLYARDGGFFAKAGIGVELVSVDNGGAMTAGIVSGAIDIGPSNVAAMAAAFAHGLHLNLFAPSIIISSNSPPTTVMGVRADSPLHSPKDFAGKTIACNTLRDLQQAAVMTWLDKNGGDSKSVSFVEVPNPEQLDALAARRVDAACLVEPFISSVKGDVRFIGRPYDSLGKQIMTFGWIANKTWYDANPALVKAIVAALRDSARWANHNPAATAAINSKYSKMPVDQITAQNRQIFADGKLDPRLIQPIIDASARYGFLAQPFAASDLFAPGLG